VRVSQVTRLALAVGGIPFTDNRVDFKAFQELKASGSTPFGSLPVLSVDGQTFAQSGALARFCGKLSGVYPKNDDTLALKIDEFVYGLDDAMAGARKSKEPADRAAWVKTDVPRYFGALDAIAKNNSQSTTWVCGPEMSIADLTLYVIVGNITDGLFDGVTKAIFDAFPRLLTSVSAVHSHPKVVEWNKSHPWKQFS
jgi:prostaglandin-H2 D-isomerase / glutathione transferase